jgi:heme ABC exporter ATP-binding subunit CcmA
VRAPALDARGIRRDFSGRPVLRGVDLTLDAGETVVLLGANGAGKSTLLRILALLLRAREGAIRIGGHDVERARGAALRCIGYLGHESGCYPDLTARENLEFAAELYGTADRARVDELLAWTGLADAVRRPLRACSRGMVQRVALARALLHRPSLVLLDEPFTGLDPGATDALDVRLRALREEGAAALITVHDVARAASLATRVLILHAGRLAWTSEGAVPEPAALAAAYRTVTAGRG